VWFGIDPARQLLATSKPARRSFCSRHSLQTPSPAMRQNMAKRRGKFYSLRAVARWSQLFNWCIWLKLENLETGYMRMHAGAVKLSTYRSGCSAVWNRPSYSQIDFTHKANRGYTCHVPKWFASKAPPANMTYKIDPDYWWHVQGWRNISCMNLIAELQ
jgi:hypothetical protein